MIDWAAPGSLPWPPHVVMTKLVVIFSALGGTFGSHITEIVFAHLDGIHAFCFSLISTTQLLVSLFLCKRETDHGRATIPVTIHLTAKPR